jgi:hypothetical protein
MEMTVTQANLTRPRWRPFGGESDRKDPAMTTAVTLRPATYADRPEIERLAALDDERAPWDEYLLAFVGGELRAALPTGGGRALADPFHLTDEVVALLRFWAERQAGERGSGGTRTRRHIRLHARAGEAAA